MLLSLCVAPSRGKLAAAADRRGSRSVSQLPIARNDRGAVESVCLQLSSQERCPMPSHPGRALPHAILLVVAILASTRLVEAQPIIAAGRPAQLDVRAAGEHSIRVTLKPVDFAPAFPVN